MDGRPVTFETVFSKGRKGEGLIALYLRRHGWNVLPVYEKEMGEFKGPVLYQATGDPLICPDLLCFRDGQARWVEAKTKSAFSWHRITGKWTTGIDRLNYDEYRRVRSISSWPLWLLFLQQPGQRAKNSPVGCPSGLFGQELGELEKTINHTSKKWGKGGMVYWSAESLVRVCSYESVADLPSPTP